MKKNKKKNKGHKAYTVCFLFSPALDSVLLQLKKKTDFAGKLNGVGGKLEPGESPVECAVREIREETGVEEIRALTWLGTLSLPFNCDTHADDGDPDDPPCILHYYAGVLHDVSDVRKPDGGEELYFYPVRQVIGSPLDGNELNLAGDGDVQYFVKSAYDMFAKRMENGGLLFYDVPDDSAGRTHRMSSDALEAAYRIRERQYHVQDAKDHAAEFLEDEPERLAALDEGDYEAMAERFEDGHDCNVPDNDQWDNVIKDYLRK